MKKGLKKTAALAMAGVLAAGLTACGGGGTAATTAAPETKKEETTTKAETQARRRRRKRLRRPAGISSRCHSGIPWAVRMENFYSQS